LKQHTRLYLNYFAYHESEYIPCEVCNKKAVDIHHIDCKGMGGSKQKDYIENLQALCRECHLKYGDKKQYKEFLEEIHLKKLQE